MNKINLIWTIGWGLVFVFGVVSIFWKPAVFIAIAISATFFGMFLYDYITGKKLE